jgi:hypothetical protein
MLVPLFGEVLSGGAIFWPGLGFGLAMVGVPCDAFGLPIGDGVLDVLDPDDALAMSRSCFPFG